MRKNKNNMENTLNNKLERMIIKLDDAKQAFNQLWNQSRWELNNLEKEHLNNIVTVSASLKSACKMKQQRINILTRESTDKDAKIGILRRENWDLNSVLNC